VLQAVAAESIFPEAAIVSTCNRTEFYFAADAERPGDLPHLLAHVAEVTGRPPQGDISLFYRHDGPEAVRHLFRVVSSLESQIVGEREIQGQVKEAYRIACEARTAKFLLHKLMHWSFRTAKRVMTETELGRGTASVSQAAVDLAAQVFSSLAGKTVLLVGAGQTSELACQALLRAGATRLILANRTEANARQLAERFVEWRRQEAARRSSGAGEGEEPIRCPALAAILARCSVRPPAEETPTAPLLDPKVISLEEIPLVIAEADLLICSTGASEPVIRAENVRGPLAGIRHSLVMIDISVPRNIEPAVEKLPNVFLYNIDALEALVARNVERRRQEIPRAAAIVDDEVDRFGQWLASLGVVPTIKRLTQRFADLQQAEIARYQKKFSGPDRAQLQEFARTLCAKVLHDPISFLRQLDGGKEEPADPASVSILRQFFNLDEKEEET
jgi:glutamyl-tRNA reductase